MSDQEHHEEENESHHGMRHTLMMLVCCLLPIAAVFSLIQIFPGNPYLGFLAVAICPLSMVLTHVPDFFSKKKKPAERCH
jgi:hypothetical protein